MPLLNGFYSAPIRLPGGYLQTIYPALFSKYPVLPYKRVRINTPDDDFLDIDTLFTDSHKLAVLSHGLEGHSRRPYLNEMASRLRSLGYDVMAWNFRGCSGEPNRKVYSYHGGATNDLQTVLEYAWSLKRFEQVILVGFSLGGNLTLRYLGEVGTSIDPRIKAGMGISVPCDFVSGAETLDHWSRRPFVHNFLRTLRPKIEEKAKRFPNQISSKGFDEIKTFRQFDERYVAPFFGFNSAKHYWESVSCRPVLTKIAVPVFILNAVNDPFLGASCFPIEEATHATSLFLEMPQTGGHNGFPIFNPSLTSYAPLAVCHFLNKHVSWLNSCQHLAESGIF